MYSAIDIAKIFVHKGMEDNEPVNQMQLQKLVYFANGALLAYTDGKEKLVKEEFQAWDYGPVIPEIYKVYKIYGANPIEINHEILRFIGKSYDPNTIELKEDLHKKVVSETWESLKGIPALKLSAWTHKEGSAWSKVYKPGVKNIPLIDKDIVAEFKPLLQSS